MWLTVLKLDEDLITGQLDNEPVHVKKVRLGSRVKVRARIVGDWLYTDGDALTGAFTVKVLQEMGER